MDSQANINQKPILVVDDDYSIRALIVDALNDAGYGETRDVDNGLDAIALLKEASYDLVISDLKMPGMSGLELLGRIKEIDPSTSVIIMTGFPSVDLSVSAMKDGAFDFITKPFKIDDLIYKVNIHLRGKKLLSEDELNIQIEHTRLHEKSRELSTIGYIYESVEKTQGDNNQIFREIVDLALRVADAESAVMVLYDEDKGLFHLKMEQHEKTYKLASGDQLIAALNSLLEDVVSTRRGVIQSGNSQTVFRSLLCVPLMIRKKVFGLLILMNKRSEGTFTLRELNYIENLTARASLNIENQLLYESLFLSIMDTLKSLVHSIHVRDHYTERHSHNVTRIALKIADSMGLTAHEIETLRIASILHDIGKIAIPDSVLLKPDKLSTQEYDIIKTHSSIGESILKSIALFETERKIIRHHHERWDGRGYPNGLSKEGIPLLSRILSVADTFDAMTSDRPYRKGLTRSVAFQELLKNKESQFDARIVDAFIAMQNI